MASSWRLAFVNFALQMVLVVGLYYSALSAMVRFWRRDQYNYCYLIPFVVLYLIWDKRAELASISYKPSWKGLIPFVFGLALYWVGSAGGENLSLLLSFWLVLVGICWMQFGWQKLKTISFAFVFMLTMFPLPDYVNNKLMLQLRLISSKLGVLMIQLFGMPVTREGNIIDLGFTQLQVVEACSGLNSLISLSVLALLLVYFFKAHIWKRCALLLSAVPLAIFTNSLRIAVTAILFKYMGADAAQGFFHGFSGLVIFLICIPLMLIWMKILEKFPPVEPSLSSETSDSEECPAAKYPETNGTIASPIAAIRLPICVVAVLLLGTTLALSQAVEFREKIPVIKSLNQFPLNVGNWSAKERQSLEDRFLRRLHLSDYIMADYQNKKSEQVNFYMAYYESQSMGRSTHTPESCLPGSGWSFEDAGSVSLSTILDNPDNGKISRAVVQYGSSKQVVYYWFAMRGRVLQKYYLVKMYNFWDAITKQRTDGALVRLVTPLYEGENLADADARLQGFLRDIVPVVEAYIPGRELHSSSSLPG
jgi:exosortase D (VPLPA-CTERM-specific)